MVSTRIRCGRSVEGFPFNPNMSEQQYSQLESLVSATLQDLTEDHEGVYYPLTGMSKDVQQQLIDDHFLFKARQFLEILTRKQREMIGR